jgi:hypothetical protein
MCCSLLLCAKDLEHFLLKWYYFVDVPFTTTTFNLYFFKLIHLDIFIIRNLNDITINKLGLFYRHVRRSPCIFWWKLFLKFNQCRSWLIMRSCWFQQFAIWSVCINFYALSQIKILIFCVITCLSICSFLLQIVFLHFYI